MVGALLGLWGSYHAKIVFAANTSIEIKKGDTVAKFYAHQSSFDQFMTKLWLRNNQYLLPKLTEGTYILSGAYTK